MPVSTSEAPSASSTTLQGSTTVTSLDPATASSTSTSSLQTEPTRTPSIPITKMTSTPPDHSQPFPVPPSVTPPSPSSGFSTSPRHHFRMCDVLAAPELQSDHPHSNSLTNAAELWWKAKGDGNGLERVTVPTEWNRSGSRSSATPTVPDQTKAKVWFGKARPATPIAASNDVVVVGPYGTSSSLLHNTAASPNEEEAVRMNHLRRRGASGSDPSWKPVTNAPASEPVA
ncbi:BQ2448_2083 [Microbotryum intermedium]|uniref:BQ2448_2083 protein n=1 Tax=Microbotryum intermedium TaxID=269621 RepID=A0A238FAL9_9BASI|nr:BQ2448_2083 [Microbotryum intermedium]